MTELTEFKGLELPDRIDLMDRGFPSVVESTPASDLYSLLKGIILDPNENSYVRRIAIRHLTDLVFLDRLKVRQELNILIDDWKPAATFIEIQRLKDLSLLYDSAPDDIEQILSKASRHEEAEIAAEGFYQMGLIELQKSLRMADRNESLDRLQKGISAFEASTGLIENRGDADFFLAVSRYLTCFHEERPIEAESVLPTVERLMFEMEAFSFATGPGPLLVSFYNTLSALRSIKSEPVAEWLDYRKGFEKLFLLFNKFQSAEVNRRLNEGGLHGLLKDFLITNAMNPFFAKSFAADEARLNVALSDPDLSTEERSFLKLLKDLAKRDDLKKTSETASIREALSSALPTATPESINRELSKIRNADSPREYIEIFRRLSGKTSEELLDAITWASITLQKDKIYRDLQENDRNTQIGNLLLGQGFRVKDQTLRGSSASGKLPGELDIFVEYSTGLPMAVIEAFVLGSLDKGYIAEHLDKIFKYDTAGNRTNYIMVYSESKNFESLWNKYVEFVKSYEFEFPLKSFELLAVQYSEIKFAEGKHDRNGTEVSLIHIVVNMAK